MDNKASRTSLSDTQDDDDDLDLLDTSNADTEALWNAKLEVLCSDNGTPVETDCGKSSGPTDHRHKFGEGECLCSQPDVIVVKTENSVSAKCSETSCSYENRLPDVVNTDKQKLSEISPETKSKVKKLEDVSNTLGSRYKISEDLEDFESDSDSELPTRLSNQRNERIFSHKKLDSCDSSDTEFGVTNSPPPNYGIHKPKEKLNRKYSSKSNDSPQLSDQSLACDGNRKSSDFKMWTRTSKPSSLDGRWLSKRQGKIKRPHETEIEDVSPGKVNRLSNSPTVIDISSSSEDERVLSPDQEAGITGASVKAQSETIRIKLGKTVKEANNNNETSQGKKRKSTEKMHQLEGKIQKQELSDEFHTSNMSATQEEIRQVKEMFPHLDRNWIKKEIKKLKKQKVTDYLERLCDVIADKDCKPGAVLRENSNSSVSSEPDVVVALGNSRIELNHDLETDSHISGKVKTHSKHSATSLKGKGKSAVKKRPIQKFTDEFETAEDEQQDINMVNDDQVTSSSLMCESCKTDQNFDRVVQCNDGHLICNVCVESHVKPILSDNSQETAIKCACEQCKSTIPHSQASKILPPIILELLLEKQNKQAMESISKMDDLVRCPSCSFPVVIDDEIKEFECPSCKVKNCRYCKRKWADANHEDCNRFTQYSPDNSKDLEPPSYWAPMPEEGDKDYIIVQLDVHSVEYTHVMSMFHKSMVGDEISSIWRIQNPRLWQKFCLARKHMIEDISYALLNEKQLFHGTDTRAFDSILKEGLDWRMCGQNGTAFGQGTYFAKYASYSRRFAHNLGVNFKFTQQGPQTFVQAQNLPSIFGPPQQPQTSTFGNNGSGHQQSGGLFGPNFGQGGFGSSNGMFGSPPVNPNINNSFVRNHGTNFVPSNVFRTSSNMNFGNQPRIDAHGSMAEAFSQVVSTNSDKTNIISTSVDEVIKAHKSYLFVARVLVGRPCNGQPNIRKPPIDIEDPRRRPFNSCVDNVTSPKIFVVFDSAQSYPEYLIEFS